MVELGGSACGPYPYNLVLCRGACEQRLPLRWWSLAGRLAGRILITCWCGGALASSGCPCDGGAWRVRLRAAARLALSSFAFEQHDGRGSAPGIIRPTGALHAAPLASSDRQLRLMLRLRRYPTDRGWRTVVQSFLFCQCLVQAILPTWFDRRGRYLF